MSKDIPLTQGYVAIVDDGDYQELAQYKWYAHRVTGGDFYAVRNTPTINGKRLKVKMHRQILGAMPTEQVDHRSHDTLDNRRANIRKCTRSQNQANREKKRGCASRHKGVTRRKDSTRWRARIKHQGRWHRLGTFDDERDAARAYNVAALEYFGEFAFLNEV